MQVRRIALVLGLSATLAFVAFAAQKPATPVRYEGLITTVGGPGPTEQLRFTIHVDRWTTKDERTAYLAALKSGGQDALLKAVENVEAGYIQVEQKLRWRLRVISIFQGPKGLVVRVATDRPIQFKETEENSRSLDYKLGIMEFTLPADGSPGTGQMLAAARVNFDGDGNLVVESLPRNTTPQPVTQVRQTDAPAKK